MSIQIVRSLTGRNFRRSGTSFPPAPTFLAIDTADYGDSGSAILAEPKLEAFEVTDTDDTDLLESRIVLNAEIIPAPT